MSEHLSHHDSVLVALRDRSQSGTCLGLGSKPISNGLWVILATRTTSWFGDHAQNSFLLTHKDLEVLRECSASGNAESQLLSSYVGRQGPS